SNPNFYAVNLATGVETRLGNLGVLTGSGSFGLWTVVERGGYLYVQTTDNGIQVWNMIGSITVGTLDTIYAKVRLDELIGYSGQYYGFDVSPDGKKMLLGSGQGTVFELGFIPPLVLQTAINFATD